MKLNVAVMGYIGDAKEPAVVAAFSAPDYLNAFARAANQITWWRRHHAAHGIRMPNRYVTEMVEGK